VLRASYGTGFLPPAIEFIAPSIYQNINYANLDPFLLDSRRGNTQLGILRLGQAGNANLVPEDSESLSVGAIFTPRFLPGLRLSMDYTAIDKTNEIGSLGGRELLQYGDLFPDRVVRGALTPADADLGYTAGPVIEFYEGQVNFAWTKIRAVDMQADYTWDTASRGSFTVFSLPTRQLEYRRQLRLDLPVFNTVGFSDGPTKWRASGGMTWEKGLWGAGWNFTHLGSSLMYAASSDATAQRATFMRTQGTFRRPSQMSNDVFLKYRFSAQPLHAAQLLADAELMVGVKNVFNEYFVLAETGPGLFSLMAGPHLRSYSVSFSKQW
jgi:iron complex outermembrane receptor protein